MDTLSASVLRDRKPQIGIVLGSGLGALAERIEGAEALPYSDIPGFPVSTAPEHKGRFVFGTIGDKEVVLMDGRVHLYEGYTPQQVVMPIRLMRQMGIHTVLLTNASGGIRRDLHAGDLMLLTDHISSLVPSPCGVRTTLRWVYAFRICAMCMTRICSACFAKRQRHWIFR